MWHTTRTILGLFPVAAHHCTPSGLKIRPTNEGNRPAQGTAPHFLPLLPAFPRRSLHQPLLQVCPATPRSAQRNPKPKPPRLAVATAMGGPPAAAASTSTAPRRRSTRLIGAPRHDDDQDKPSRAAPSPKPASTSSASSKPRIRLAALRRRGYQPPPPPRVSTPPPAAEEADAPPPSRAAAPRRSVRVHLCVRGLPSAAAPSIPWRRRRSPAAPPPKSIEAKAEEWAKEKAASGAPEEECDLPFLRKGAPRKVECLICSKSILPDERVQCSVNHCDVTLHKACSEKTDGCCLRHDAGPVDDIKTQQCGWGAIALETIEEDDFVIEFIGEVIDDAMCEDRLQDMRERRDQNFYMCRVSKDFVIDATFRGNACRFFNHSCQPNCRLDKWQVNRKTRLGVFASETIKVGTPLTYNYSISVQIKNVSAELPTAEGNCD
ncbi:hypothetical protein U9M48_008288, partial [Paspalum notatum var. saurae]